VPNATITLLLSPEGTLLASHSAAGGIGGGQALLKLLPAQDIAAILKQSDIGYVSTDRLGSTHILAFDTVEPVKWTLVSIAEESALGSQ
jgi:hypothetical protein